VSKGRELLVGFVIIAAVAVGVLGTLWLKRAHWGRPLEPLEILVPDVAQLTPGDAVVFRGVRIGRVSAIQVEPDGQAVRVSVNLEEQVNLPADAGAVVAPESMFGDWQTEIVSRSRYPRYHFYEVPKADSTAGVRVLGGYTLPELTRLTASAEEISTNLANLTDRLELAFNEETAQNLSRAIDNIEAVSSEIRTLVNQEAAVAASVTANADSALNEIEQASRAARVSFERVQQLLTDAQTDSIIDNVQLATGNIRKVSGVLANSSGDLTSTLARMDSSFARLDRITAQLESGRGSLGRLLADSTFAVRAEGVLEQLDLLLKDLRENPRRYVRLSIF
jgi:phospholipid/cholesterol/gamma-HCH transport system substrate-binding protein